MFKSPRPCALDSASIWIHRSTHGPSWLGDQFMLLIAMTTISDCDCCWRVNGCGHNNMDRVWYPGQSQPVKLDPCCALDSALIWIHQSAHWGPKALALYVAGLAVTGSIMLIAMSTTKSDWWSELGQENMEQGKWPAMQRIYILCLRLWQIGE